MKNFSLEKSETELFYYELKIDLTDLPIKTNQDKSYLLPCRLLGINFDKYLRICKHNLKAKIKIVNREPKIYFRRTRLDNVFVRILNKRLEYALLYKSNPNLNPNSFKFDIK